MEIFDLQALDTGASPTFFGLNLTELSVSGIGTFGGVTVTGCCVLGLNSAVFQPTTDSATFFQVLDANGGTPILNVDSTNERVGIGTNSPGRPMEIFGSAPVLRLRDSGATASATVAFIEFGGTDAGVWSRTGWVGDGSSGDTNISLWAEVGNLQLGDSSGIDVLTLSGGDATFSGSINVGTSGKIYFRDTDISIGSTLTDGILDITADFSIDLFFDNADVGNEADGQSLNINRRAVEGDDYISLYVDKDKRGLIGFSGDNDLLQLTANALTVNGTLDVGAITGTGLTLSNDLIFSADKVIRRDTADASDDGTITISGGGGTSVSRGANIILRGNEAASNPGDLNFNAGSISTGDISFGAGGTSRFDITNAGELKSFTTFFLDDRANALADIPGFGQIWCKSVSPSEFWYTGDSGVDRLVSGTNHYVTDAGIFHHGDATDYSEFESDGTYVMNGAATVFNDLIVPLSSAKVPPANAPSWVSFVGNLNAYAYDLNDFQEFSTELAHSYKDAALIEFHVHGTVNGSNVDDRTMKFEVEYSIANVPAEAGFGDVFPAPTTINGELTIPASTTDRTGFTIDIGDDVTGNFVQGAIVKGRVRRIASTGTEPTADPFLTEVGLHIESDTIGTRTATAK